MLLAYVQPLGSGNAVDAAVDLEQSVNAFDCFQRDDRRDRSRAFLPRLALAAMSASSKNCLLAWAQHSADVTGPAARAGSYSSL